MSVLKHLLHKYLTENLILLSISGYMQILLNPYRQRAESFRIQLFTLPSNLADKLHYLLVYSHVFYNWVVFPIQIFYLADDYSNFSNGILSAFYSVNWMSFFIVNVVLCIRRACYYICIRYIQYKSLINQKINFKWFQ